MADTWYECKVMRTGPAEDGTIFIWLREKNNNFNHWFKTHPLVKKEMMAVALSAMAMDKGVHASLPDTKAYTTINRLYVDRDLVF